MFWEKGQQSCKVCYIVGDREHRFADMFDALGAIRSYLNG